MLNAIVLSVLAPLQTLVLKR